MKLVAMATSFDRSKKKARIIFYEKYLPFGENTVKIGPVDPEIRG